MPRTVANKFGSKPRKNGHRRVPTNPIHIIILYVVIVVIGLAAFNQNVALSPAQVVAQNILRGIPTALMALEVVVIGRAIVLAGEGLVSTVRGSGSR